MRLSEDLPLDPVVLAELEAIDATLRGEAVDPAHAELAELALLLAADRPQLPAEAARSLDAAVARRFVPVVAGPRAGGDAYAGDRAGAGTSTGAHGGRGGRGTDRWGARVRGWARRPAFGLALAGVVAVAVAGVAVVGLGQTGGSRPGSLATASTASGTTAGSSAGTSSAAATPAGDAPTRYLPGAAGSASQDTQANSFGGGSAAGTASGSPTTAKAAASTPAQTTPSSASSTGQTESLFPPSAQTATTNGATAPAPASNGRKTIQSAQLQLIASGDRIDQVSQEVFDVIGHEGGIVKSSTITAGGGNNGYASFQLSIPSANLAQTMTQLSQLRYATVASRTDQTQDVNDQYNADVRALADAKAVRTSLLKQLANAATQTQIDSLQAQIKDNEAQIAGGESALASLNNKVNYSSLQVEINAGTVVPVPVPSAGSSSGFTLHRAWHDAVRVLTVTAGVALIALAVLLPIALLVAIGLWVVGAVRRHRRESALDAA